MYDAIKKSHFRVKWNIREVHKITQWKDGCVYRTKSLGLICCKDDYKLYLRGPNMHQTYIIGSASTKVTSEIAKG